MEWWYFVDCHSLARMIFVWKILIIFYTIFLGISCLSSHKSSDNNISKGSFVFSFPFLQGNLYFDSDLFTSLSNCKGRLANCAWPADVRIQKQIDEKKLNFDESIPIGNYFAVTKISYTEVSHWDCRSGELKIYHGFDFEIHPREDKFWLYEVEECYQKSEDIYICPRINISETNKYKIEMDQINVEASGSMKHLIANPYTIPFIFAICGPTISRLHNFKLSIQK